MLVMEPLLGSGRRSSNPSATQLSAKLLGQALTACTGFFHVDLLARTTVQKLYNQTCFVFLGLIFWELSLISVIFCLEKDLLGFASQPRPRLPPQDCSSFLWTVFDACGTGLFPSHSSAAIGSL